MTEQVVSQGQELESGKRVKHLVFQLGEEFYGVPLSMVKEVIGITEITPVPHVPKFFKGFINLRGKIISVIDLRTKLSLKEREYAAKKTSIIITEVDELVIGAIVDDVREVIGFEHEQIEHSVDIQSNVSRDFITGVAKTNEKKLIILLDLGKTLDTEDLKAIRKLQR